MAEARAPGLAEADWSFVGEAIERSGVSIRWAGDLHRFILRAPDESIKAIGEAIGVELPPRPKTAHTAGEVSALWLGPDEWLVISEGGDRLSGCRGSGVLHSAVDVSHRNVGFALEGPSAEAVLQAGCPQDLDLSTFPVGACSRTILGKIEAVVWRRAEQRFHLEVWRSFAPYALDFLAEAARDPLA